MYAGVVITPSCENVDVAGNTIYGMALANPSNDSPLAYGILTYVNDHNAMPNGS